MIPLLRRADLLAGGFLLTFSSSLGQTWFIALSGPALRGELGLSNGAFGTLYSLATLSSGLALGWLGAGIDRLAPRSVALGLAVGIGLACLGMATVGHPLALLGVLFALRLCGQGLMSNLAMTTLARSFPDARGRALALGGTGYSAAEAVLPVLVAVGLAALGWRQTWTVAGTVALLALPPLFAFLLRRARVVQATPEAAATSAPALSRREILSSGRFALLLPAIMTSGFVITAVFFHQGALSAAKGWPAGWFAACIPAYAAAEVTANLAVGVLVDRYGARRLMPLFLLPLAGAMALLATTDAPLLALAAMALTGLTNGASNTVITAGLAELYGSANLGAVRALGASATIIASALSPALAGIALDAGVPVGAVLLACLGLCLAAGPLAARAVLAGGPALAGARAA